MYDVKIINKEAILFDDENEMNIEHLRDEFKHIRYTFDDGNYVCINSFNNIIWFDSDGKIHRDGDIPAYISNDGYMLYKKHGNIHRECGLAIIHEGWLEEYWIDGNIYTKKEYINEINSKYGIIYMI